MIAKLSDPKCPSPAAIQAEVGSGVNTVIEHLIEDFARSMSVLVVVPNYNALVQQWVSRLGERKGIGQVQPLSVPLALDMLDHSVPGSGSVLVAKVMDLRRPVIQRFLQTWAPGLLIIDAASVEVQRPLTEGIDQTSHAGTLLRSAMTSSHRTIVVTRDQSIGDIPIVATLVRPERPNIHVNRYAFNISPSEVELMETAGRFTQENHIKQWHDAPRTRPTLMDRLLRIATAEFSTEESVDAAAKGAEVAETSWRYIDALEHLGTDPRLNALDQAIDECDRSHIFVVSPNLAELDYVVQHLESMYQGVRKIGSTVDATQSFEEAVEPTAGRLIFGATPSALRWLTAWPDSAALIIWSRDNLVLDQLADLLQESRQDPYIAVIDSLPES